MPRNSSSVKPLLPVPELVTRWILCISAQNRSYKVAPATIRSGLSFPLEHADQSVRISAASSEVLSDEVIVTFWFCQNAKLARLIPPTVPVEGASATWDLSPVICLPALPVPSE